MKRVVSLIAIALITLSACGTSDSADDGLANDGSDATVGIVDYGNTGAVVVPVEQLPASPRDDSLPSGLATFSDPDPTLPSPTIDLSILRSGGPPPDGIPSIDTPVFHDALSVDYLGDDAPVIALEIDGDARAYPLEILIWHELVNDTVGGVPVSVAYCPLCNSVTVYEREIDGQVLDFGVSGLLYNSSLVMYDRQTETLWSHFTGEPLYGALADADLVSIPATIVGFGTWLEEHPDGLVLSRNTGVSRSYGVNPYPGYDDVDARPFLFEGDVDGRFTAMTRVVGVEADDGSAAAAFPLLDLRERGVLTTELGEQSVAAFWVPGSTSALDAEAVGRGVDVGATGVFSATVDGRELTFSSTTDVDGAVTITDDETGSTWNIFGKAVDGELAGGQLEQLVHIDTFWFAWIAFHPTSSVAG